MHIHIILQKHILINTCIAYSSCLLIHVQSYILQELGLKHHGFRTAMQTLLCCVYYCCTQPQVALNLERACNSSAFMDVQRSSDLGQPKRLPLALCAVSADWYPSSWPLGRATFPCWPCGRSHTAGRATGCRHRRHDKPPIRLPIPLPPRSGWD